MPAEPWRTSRPPTSARERARRHRPSEPPHFAPHNPTGEIMNKARLLHRASSVLAVAALLAACGDDDSTDTAAEADTPETTASFTGEPVHVGLIVPTETAGANFPEVIAAVEAATMAINERGGIAGHEVEVVYCNEGDDPNQAGECAQQMIDDGVIATVSSFSRRSEERRV